MSQELPKSIKLTVITPTKLLVDEEVREVSLPSLEGYLGIFPGHRPLFAALGQGVLTFKGAYREGEVPVRRGYAEVLSDRVLVFVEEGEDETARSSEGKG
jgi:F-type H+-transporting ATPase subunit epsilon